MAAATVNGVKLEYEVLGSGEPMLFIHGALVAAAGVAAAIAAFAAKDRLS